MKDKGNNETITKEIKRFVRRNMRTTVRVARGWMGLTPRGWSHVDKICR